MYAEVITEKTQQFLESLDKTRIIKDFYLAGGTALALQYGHRKSKDFDFFSLRNFSNKKILQKLSRFGRIKILTEEPGTLNITLNGIRISFFKYKYKLLFRFIKFKKINLADPRDIACMKINAVSSRGSKKDFIDLYFLLKKYSLNKLFDLFSRKYKDIKYNKLHILRSLTFFADADKEPMPLMISKIKWPDAKEELQRKVKIYLL